MRSHWLPPAGLHAASVRLPVEGELPSFEGAFHARDLHMVMGSAGRTNLARFQVRLDGQPPGAGHGIDADAQGHGTVAEPRLYQLIRQPGPVTERTFEITFADPGAQAYAFTFG